MSKMKEIGKIGEDRTLRAAGRGGALYLYLPKDFVELHGIIAGDRIEVKLGKIYRKTEYVEEAEKRLVEVEHARDKKVKP